MQDLLIDVLADVLDGDGLRTAFQPVVDLSSGRPVGYEALARGPVASALERPDALFAAARERDVVVALDTRCQVAAIETALADRALTSPQLFVNAEPETLGYAPDRLLDTYRRAARVGLPIVVEVTERSVTARPAELLASLTRIRATGARIAMDDVGADLRALAFLPLVRPDVIKLDLALVQQQPSPAIARIVTAVNAAAERTGAVVLAEGIETAEHLATARALGATLGQGWRYGRPEPLPAVPADLVDLTLGTPFVDAAADLTPYRCCATDGPERIARKSLLIEISKHLEAEAAAIGEVGVLLSTFQHAHHFTADTRRRYHDLADRLAFVAALGAGLPTVPLPGVRGASLRPDDEVVGEWDVVVLGPHFAAALTARDLGDGGPERDRRFAFVVTYDRDRVVDAARSLVARVAADGPAATA